MDKLRKAVLLIISCFVFASSLQAQKKADLYILFKEDASEGVFKSTLSETSKNGHQQNYDLYDLSLNADLHHKYQFSKKNGTNPLVVNKSYVTRLKPKTIGWLRSRKEAFWPTWNKKFPYQHLYLVEPLDKKKFNITEVETFFGEDF